MTLPSVGTKASLGMNVNECGSPKDDWHVVKCGSFRACKCHISG